MATQAKTAGKAKTTKRAARKAAAPAKRPARKKMSATAKKAAAKKAAATRKKAQQQDQILRRLSGGETMTSICRDADMPCRTLVHYWKEDSKEFRERLARARDLGYDALADEAIEISDTQVESVEVEQALVPGEDGAPPELVVTKRKIADNVAHRKLQVWTRLQLLARWDPARYGASVKAEVTGKGGGPVQHEHTVAGILAEIDGAGTGLDAPGDGGE